MDVSLRQWAEAHAVAGVVQARQVLELLDEAADKRRRAAATVIDLRQGTRVAPGALQT